GPNNSGELIRITTGPSHHRIVIFWTSGMSSRRPFSWSISRMFRIVTGFAVFFYLCRYLDRIPYEGIFGDILALVLSILPVVFAIRGNSLLATSFMICAGIKSAIEFLHFPMALIYPAHPITVSEVVRDFAISSAVLPTIAFSLLLGFGRFPLSAVLHRSLRWT